MSGRESGREPHGADANPDSLEVVAGFQHQKLEGWVPELATPEETLATLEQAFDYRGDVSITRKDGSKIEGYIFDRRTGPSLSGSFVRLYPKDSPEKFSIAYSEIAALAFSPRARSRSTTACLTAITRAGHSLPSKTLSWAPSWAPRGT